MRTHCHAVLLEKHFHVLLRHSEQHSLRHTEDISSLEPMGGSIWDEEAFDMSWGQVMCDYRNLYRLRRIET